MLTHQQMDQIEELLSRMTLEEKIGQMNQESPSIVGGFDVSFEELIDMVEDGRISKEEFGQMMASAHRDYHEADIRTGRIGSVMVDDPEKANELQKIAVEESRLGIPLLIGYDVIHGLKTVYPIALAEAGAFDEDLFVRTAEMAAKEARAYGINWTFGPMLDVARDARWGRVSEGPGEDPYLVSRFARAKVRGLQGNTSEETDMTHRVAACAKHFAAYSACEAGRDYNTTTMSVSQLYNTFLPPFKAAMEEGAMTAMAAFNDLNGIPCTVNQWLLRDIMKKEMGLQGFIVSDANAIRECVTHGIAADESDAGVQALRAGLDMDMGTHIYQKNLTQAVQDGRVSMEMVDEAVRRILWVKTALGLFENPYVPEEEMLRCRSIPKENRALTREAAVRSIVLLKNEENVLPLRKNQKISLVGTLADQPGETLGAWAMSGRPQDCVSIREGLLRAGIEVQYYPCAGPEGDLDSLQLQKAAEEGDVVIAVVGETAQMSGEAASRADITLPGKQREMLKHLLESGKPLVTVLMNGRPLALGWEAEHLPVLMEAWHLGIEMGNAIADVLFGEEVPSGKLAVTIPAVTGQCPMYYNHLSTGRPGTKSKYTSKYLDAPLGPAFPFGYGLSYTTFSYSDLQVREEEETLQIRVSVKNSGSRDAWETVQLYMQDVTASLVRPVKELKGFRRVYLHAGEQQCVHLTLDKQEMGFYDNQGLYRLEDGEFRIYAGSNSQDCLCAQIGLSFTGS